MSPQSQRIAIAESCGWRRTSSVSGIAEAWIDGPEYNTLLPDYLNDLNAMHEAEKTLDAEAQYRFINNLADILKEGSDWMRWPPCIGNVFRAASAQRAEAFLKTIGEWDDSK